MPKRRASRSGANRGDVSPNAKEQKLRVWPAEALHFGRTNADGTPQRDLDSLDQRKATIDAVRQRAEALSFRYDPDGGSASSAGLNVAFADDLRAARIFALHLSKLGVTRLLDVGAGDGRFGQQVRRFGYNGVIYSVEPRWPRYLQLLSAASGDSRWIPLARQAASDVGGSIELPLIDEGRPGVALPHGIPAPAASVRSALAHEVLNPVAINQVQALRINVSGLEGRILEGLSPILGNLRLIMLHGTPSDGRHDGFFALDDRLVSSWGFSRASVEPAGYDDDAGTARHYHGIYLRPGEQQAAAGDRITVGAVVTSVGGQMKRLRPDGADVGQWWGNTCINSWRTFSDLVVSVSETPPPSEAITWSRCASKPAIAELFHRMQDIEASHLVLTNADIYLTEALKDVLSRLAPGAVYYGNRHEVQLREGNASDLVSPGYFSGGFDYFVLPREFIETVNEHKLIPDVFLVGEPWWDYIVPTLALATGFACKKLPTSTMYALHYSHAERASKDQWRENGELFVNLIRSLYDGSFPYSKELLAQLLRQPQTDLDNRLWHVAEIICYALP